jgi:hypothetical protein
MTKSDNYLDNRRAHVEPLSGIRVVPCCPIPYICSLLHYMIETEMMRMVRMHQAGTMTPIQEFDFIRCAMGGAWSSDVRERG